MSDPGRRLLTALVLLLVLAGGLWLLRPGSAEEPESARVVEAPAPIPPEHMPAPFGERRIRPPDPEAPAPSQTAAFCSPSNWSRIEELVSPGGPGEFRVDPEEWRRTLTTTQVGIASWMSTCKGDGERVRIVSADSGDLLATYDPGSGLRASSP